MTAIPSRLTVVTLGARDLPKLRAFSLALGWPELPSSDDTWAAFPLGGAMLALYPLDELAHEAAPGAVAAAPPGAWNGMALACNVETSAQVDTAYAAALAAGATSVAPPTDREWGGRSAYVADPEGNRWELAWARNAVFDERGAVTSLG